MKLRVTTFNCENLFGRYAFLDKPESATAKNFEDVIKINEVVAFKPGRGNGVQPKPIAEAQRKNTGATILAVEPDILAVAEVENLITLRLFNAKYLKNYFDRMILIDGNDPRGIDVGLLIKRGLRAEILNVRSHADDAKDGGFLPTSNRLDTKNGLGNAQYSRDCLEVDVKVRSTVLTMLVNHLKAQDASPKTPEKRKRQAKATADIARQCIARGTNPIVLGDLNMDVGNPKYDKSLDPLLNSPELIDPFMALANNWTHFYAAKKTVSRLDYFFVDKRLGNAVAPVDQSNIFRGGLSPKCTQFTGKRVGTIAKDGLEASDHCAVSIDLDL